MLGSQTNWKWWIVLWAALAVVQTALLANNAALDTLTWRTTRWFWGDNPPYNWAAYKQVASTRPNAPFYDRIDPPLTVIKNGVPEARWYKRTEKFWRLMRDLGEPYTTALLLVTVSLYDRRRWKAGVMLLAAAAIAGGLSTLVRYCGGRFRPEHINGENIWQLWRGGTDLSWPSGHATLAFATAAALTYLSPRGRWLFVFLAAACAVARVVMQAHFWSDVIMGSVLGWSVGWFVTVWIDRMMKTNAAVSPPGPAKA